MENRATPTLKNMSSDYARGLIREFDSLASRDFATAGDLEQIRPFGFPIYAIGKKLLDSNKEIEDDSFAYSLGKDGRIKIRHRIGKKKYKTENTSDVVSQHYQDLFLAAMKHVEFSDEEEQIVVDLAKLRKLYERTDGPSEYLSDLLNQKAKMVYSRIEPHVQKISRSCRFRPELENKILYYDSGTSGAQIHMKFYESSGPEPEVEVYSHVVYINLDYKKNFPKLEPKIRRETKSASLTFPYEQESISSIAEITNLYLTEFKNTQTRFDDEVQNMLKVHTAFIEIEARAQKIVMEKYFPIIEKLEGLKSMKYLL